MKKTLKLISLLLCVAMLLVSFAGCTKDTGDASSVASEVASEASSEAEKQTFTGTYFDTDIWQQVPMVSKAIKDAGHAGGEGCQAMLYISYAPTNGKLAFMGTDVGGVVGFSPR